MYFMKAWGSNQCCTTYLPLDTMFPISAVRAKSPFSFLLRTCWTSHQGIYLNITTYLCT